MIWAGLAQRNGRTTGGHGRAAVRGTSRGLGGPSAAACLTTGAAVLLAACTAPPPPAADLPEGIHAQTVEVWRHEGDRAVVRAEGRTLHLDPGLTEARLGEARLEILSEGVVAEAPTARMDLEGRRVEGDGGIRVRSGASTLTGPRFLMELDTERLTLPDGVRAETEVAR